MDGFEKRLTRLEELANLMRDKDVPLEEAMVMFNEGMLISKGLEKELHGYERKVDQLVNLPDVDGSEEPEIEPF